jgi:hypothetical protein
MQLAPPQPVVEEKTVDTPIQGSRGGSAVRHCAPWAHQHRTKSREHRQTATTPLLTGGIASARLGSVGADLMPMGGCVCVGWMGGGNQAKGLKGGMRTLRGEQNLPAGDSWAIGATTHPSASPAPAPAPPSPPPAPASSCTRAPSPSLAGLRRLGGPGRRVPAGCSPVTKRHWASPAATARRTARSWGFRYTSPARL